MLEIMDFEVSCLPIVPEKWRCKDKDEFGRCKEYAYHGKYCFYHTRVRNSLIDKEKR